MNRALLIHEKKSLYHKLILMTVAELTQDDIDLMFQLSKDEDIRDNRIHKKIVTHVFLDDVRLKPSKLWTLVKWPNEAITLLRRQTVTHLSLDHDLGDDIRGTGYDVLLWIEEAVAHAGFVPPDTILVHSANTSARIKMELAVQAIKRLHVRNLKNGLRNMRENEN